MNAVGEETPGYFYDALFVIGMVRHVVSKGLDVLRCVGHGDACPGVTQHADIVVTVAAADDVCRGNAQEMEELLQAIYRRGTASLPGTTARNDRLQPVPGRDGIKGD